MPMRVCVHLLPVAALTSIALDVTRLRPPRCRGARHLAIAPMAAKDDQ
jgi:hypothetical protein